MTNSNQKNSFYNNSTSSACYINEIKRVQPKRGEEFIAVKASLVDGSMDNPSYESIDMIVKGKQATAVLTSFEDQWPTYSQENRPTIFANIRFGSLGVKPYLSRDKQPAAVLSGRLLKVNYLSLNKVALFQLTTDKADDAQVENAEQLGTVEQPSVAEQPQVAEALNEAPQAAMA